jgi:hypothetical protein
MDSVVEGSEHAQEGCAGCKTSKRTTVEPARLAQPD